MPTFTIYSLSKHQLDVIKKLPALKIQNYKELRVNIDATGTISELPKHCEDVMYLYTVVINTKNVDGCSSMNFPLCDMLTNSHTSYNIRLFIQFLKHEIEMYGISWPVFDHAITDFSKAMLNGVSLGFNDMKLIDYNNLTYD